MRGKGRKNHPTNNIMNKLPEKVLTETSAWSEEEAETFAAAEDGFEFWN